MRHKYLVQLASSLKRTANQTPNVTTKEFVECCNTILPFFDHLGPVFAVARGEFQQKLESLKQQSECKPYLIEIVEADKQANRATVKNSATRNLHRLAAAILFVKLLFERLLGRQCEVPANTNTADGVVRGVTLREAASSAYEVALAPFHTTIIKGVVRAGLLTLPSKEDFIEAIGEDEESAAVRAQEVVAACQDVHSAVNRLFVGINMPASSVWLWPSQ